MDGSRGRRSGMAVALGLGMVLGGASGARGQELAGPRIPEARPVAERVAEAGIAAPALPVVAAPATATGRRPGAAGRWLMVGGGALLAAALGDYLTDDAMFGFSDRGAAVYGAGLTLFGIGAWRTATAAPAAPPVLAAGPAAGEATPGAPRR